MRTLRIPDDDKEYPLPPGFSRFPLRHIDDYSDRVPDEWLERGGVLMPMYQSEALWLNFSTDHIRQHNTRYPFAIKIGTGKINAVSGYPWTECLSQYRDKELPSRVRGHSRIRCNSIQQNYVVAPDQPWLDGYSVGEGVIRQFVAMPFGSGISVEEQITGDETVGGLQIEIFPMKRECFEKRWLEQTHRLDLDFKLSPMSLTAGGRMKQEIYSDPYGLDEWDLTASSRCFIHLINSVQWQQITGERPPHQPFDAATYTEAGLPWFDYYDADQSYLSGSSQLSNLKSIKDAEDCNDDNLTSMPKSDQIVRLRPTHKSRSAQIREF